MLLSLKIRVIVMLVLLVGLGRLTTRADDSRDWSRFLTDADEFASKPGLSFAVSYIEHKGNIRSVALVAVCWYRFTVGSDPIVLHGKNRIDGTFQPIVSYEVATEGKTKWKKIPSDLEQTSTESLIVSPEHPVAKLWVNMQPFQMMIGTYRYGRLVLENGDAAIFAIEDLLPTADPWEDSWVFKRDLSQSDEEKKKEGFLDAWIAEPATLLSVISFGDRLVGDFLFETRGAKTISLNGSRTLDGDFWPTVTFEAARSDKVWKTIGESHHSGTPTVLNIPSGKAERMRIVLTDFKPLIGRFKYGKVVFSNGQSGIFNIGLLKPSK